MKTASTLIARFLVLLPAMLCLAIGSAALAAETDVVAKTPRVVRSQTT